MNGDLRALLRHAPFVWFLVARWLSVIALQMLMVALAWQMYGLTHSAWDLGLVGLFQFVPTLLLTLPAGQAADRWSRARIFTWCAFAQVLIGLAAAVAMHQSMQSRALILGLSVALGVVRAFQMPAQQALTPSLVPPEWLPRAIALSSSAMQVGIIGGPALGGLIYAFDPLWDYGVCAWLAFLAVLAMQGVKTAPQHPPKGSASWSEVWAGLTFVAQRKILLGAVTLDMFAVLLGGATALLPIYARDVLDVGPQGLGVLRAAPAVGALVMSLVLSRWPMRRHVGRMLLISVVCFGLSTVAFGICTQFWPALAALMVVGAADNVSVVIRSTIMQLETPDEMRGRVSAVNSVFIGASNQLGEFESGVVAHWVGPEASVISGGVGTILVACLWWKWFPQLAKRDRYVA